MKREHKKNSDKSIQKYLNSNAFDALVFAVFFGWRNTSGVSE